MPFVGDKSMLIDCVASRIDAQQLKDPLYIGRHGVYGLPYPPLDEFDEQHAYVLDNDEFQSHFRDWKAHLVSDLADRRRAQDSEGDELMEKGPVELGDDNSGSPSENGEEEDDEDDSVDDDNNHQKKSEVMDVAPNGDIFLSDAMLENMAANQTTSAPRAPSTGPPSFEAPTMSQVAYTVRLPCPAILFGTKVTPHLLPPHARARTMSA